MDKQLATLQSLKSHLASLINSKNRFRNEKYGRKTQHRKLKLKLKTEKTARINLPIIINKKVKKLVNFRVPTTHIQNKVLKLTQRLNGDSLETASSLVLNLNVRSRTHYLR